MLNYKYKKVNLNLAIIGLGYVGLPLLISLSKKFKIIGYDSNKIRINELNKFFDRNNEIEKKIIKKNKKNIIFTYDLKNLIDTNLFIITVPTPITKNNNPDLSNIKKSLIDICKLSKIKKHNKIYIILESTVYPGCTENYCKKVIENNSSMKYKSDFYLGYSPERINPGDKKNNLQNTTKLISGTDVNVINILKKIYSNVSKNIYVVKDIKTAEAAKIIENTQRDINIALINEFSNIFNKLEIDTHDVLAAAKTKWNFIDFTPGLVGGHCIGVDPYYLSYIAKKSGAKSNIILAGRKVNESFVTEVFSRIKKKIKFNNIVNPDILFMGLTFKENVPDFRNSKNLKLLSKIEKVAKSIVAFDPFIKNLSISEKLNSNITYTEYANDVNKHKYDVIIVLLKHEHFKLFNKQSLIKLLKNRNSFIFDFKNIYNEKKFLSV